MDQRAANGVSVIVRHSIDNFRCRLNKRRKIKPVNLPLHAIGTMKIFVDSI